jgi:hypothetical protein
MCEIFESEKRNPSSAEVAVILRVLLISARDDRASAACGADWEKGSPGLAEVYRKDIPKGESGAAESLARQSHRKGSKQSPHSARAGSSTRRLVVKELSSGQCHSSARIRPRMSRAGWRAV